MVIALKQFYDAIPGRDIVSRERRRAAYDRLLSASIHASFLETDGCARAALWPCVRSADVRVKRTVPLGFGCAPGVLPSVGRLTEIAEIGIDATLQCNLPFSHDLPKTLEPAVGTKALELCARVEHKCRIPKATRAARTRGVHSHYEHRRSSDAKGKVRICRITTHGGIPRRSARVAVMQTLQLFPHARFELRFGRGCIDGKYRGKGRHPSCRGPSRNQEVGQICRQSTCGALGAEFAIDADLVATTVNDTLSSKARKGLGADVTDEGCPDVARARHGMVTGEDLTSQGNAHAHAALNANTALAR